MRKKELEKLEQINIKRKLDQEIKEKIVKKVLNNFLIALDILLLFVVLIIAGRMLSKTITVIIYKLSSVILLLFTLIIFEIAYKKENDEMAIYGIEMLFLSITTLLTPYIFIEKVSIFTTIVGCYFTIYYILKNLVIYKKEKNRFFRNQNDISQIIKKESQDELAQQEKERISKLKELPKRKRGRPKKTATP